MFTKIRAVPIAPQPDTQTARASALEKIALADAEVSRLAALLQSTTRSLADAEARATDAVASPAYDSERDAVILHAVTAARAAREATAAARDRAITAAAAARNALVPIERRTRREAGEQKLEALTPALQDIDRAIRLLAGALPVVEESYKEWTTALMGTADWSGTAPHARLSAQPLQLVARIRAVLARDLGVDVFVQAHGATPTRLVPEGTVSESVATLIAETRGSIGDSEAAAA